MSESGYLNFDLEIERAGQHYGVQVLSSPAGEARAKIESSVLTQIDSAATPQVIGEQLYEAIFRGEIGTSLRRSLDEAHRQEKGLRIRLRLADAPELTNLPLGIPLRPQPRHILCAIERNAVGALSRPARAATRPAG